MRSCPGVRHGLPAGDYRATIAKNNMFDPSGNTLAADAVVNFFALPGDANRDRVVNLGDFNILAARFGQVMGPSAAGRQIAGAGAKDRMIDDLAQQLT